MSQEPIDPTVQVDAETGRPILPALQPGEVIPQRERSLKMMEEFRRLRRSNSNLLGSEFPKELRDLVDHGREVTKFPEVYFVQYFMPLFAGTVKPNETINMDTWVNIAGGEQYPVDIVNAEGTVLFRVPAFHGDGIEIVKDGRAITQFERHYSRLKEVDARGSQEFMASTLLDMHMPKQTPEAAHENTKIWNDIFRRYGYEDNIINLIEEKEGKGTSSNGTGNKNNDDTYSGGLDFS